MESFENKVAVVTGGGTGMGRELVCQLIAAGAHVAMCDVSQENMDETRRLAAAGEQRLTDHLCDVSSEPQMLADRAEAFRTQAPTTAAAAAKVILDAVRNKQWRVLVGQDARDLDHLIREAPEEAYEKSMIEKINALNHLGALI